MIEQLKDLLRTLEEEIKYHESVLVHRKNLEATLWGLEEQARMPENSSKDDQTELNEQMNLCRGKIINCKKLVDSHSKKMIGILTNFVTPKDSDACTQCPSTK